MMSVRMAMRGMTPEELEHGYAWLYERVFMPDAIWARRPTDPRAVWASVHGGGSGSGSGSGGSGSGSGGGGSVSLLTCLLLDPSAKVRSAV